MTTTPRTSRTTTRRRPTAPKQRSPRSAEVIGNTALAPQQTEPIRAPRPTRRPSLAIVPPVDLPASRTPFIMLILVLVAGGLIALLLLNTAINENAFRLHTLEQQQNKLDAKEQKLEREISQRESPGSLAAEAKRLGLVPAGTPGYIRLPDGQVMGVPSPAGSAR